MSWDTFRGFKYQNVSVPELGHYQKTDQSQWRSEISPPRTYLQPTDASREGEITSEDSHETAFRQIRIRRGQQKFRDGLVARYGAKCVVSGCAVLDVLEAAHIQPYCGTPDNRVENGLLLRADLHTLFDLDLLGIQPTPLVVRIHPKLMGSDYAAVANRTLGCGPHRPDADALQARWERFVQRCGADSVHARSHQERVAD